MEIVWGMAIYWVHDQAPAYFWPHSVLTIEMCKIIFWLFIDTTEHFQFLKLPPAEYIRSRLSLFIDRFDFKILGFELNQLNSSDQPNMLITICSH